MLKKILVAVGLGLLPWTAALAQVAPAPDSFSALLQWVGTQQAQIGTSMGYSGVKYAATWWDAFSIGQKGLNVGLASALDYMDLGPGMAAANAQRTRYGQAVPVHVGNIWNLMESNSTGTWMSHVHVTALPNVVFCPFFLWPEGNRLNGWTWKKDFQAAVGYRFGGTP